jgi:hypothetical protein
MYRLIKLIAFLTISLLLIFGCASPEPTVDSDAEDRDVADREPFVIFDLSDELMEAYLDEIAFDEMSEEEQKLYQTRSHMSDLFASLDHDLPEFFLQQVEEEEVDIYQGFRIQILSTRDVEMADSTLAEFEEWAQARISDYSPRGYIHYRQPYYRVRVGDFSDRDRAIELSRLIKFKYPDAWVIHDRINPYRAPADTAEFRIVDILEQIESFEDDEED